MVTALFGLPWPRYTALRLAEVALAVWFILASLYGVHLPEVALVVWFILASLYGVQFIGSHHRRLVYPGLAIWRSVYRKSPSLFGLPWPHYKAFSLPEIALAFWFTMASLYGVHLPEVALGVWFTLASLCGVELTGSRPR